MQGWDVRETTLSLCVLAFFVTVVSRLAPSPIAPLIIEEFGGEKPVILTGR